jgi:hypothetical protein
MIINFFNFIKYFFLILIIFLGKSSFSTETILNKKNFVDFYCKNLKIYDEMLERYGFIPNSWELDTGNLINQDIMVQPRMIQFSLNYLRIKQYSNIDSEYNCLNLSLEKNVLISIKKFSNNYENLFPWKKKQIDFVDKENEPMNIYDIGDWLTILSVASSYYSQKDLTNYAIKSSEYLIKLVNNTYDKNNKWADSFNYKLEPNFDLEIGHATLFIDGLLHVYKDLKLDNALILAEKIYNDIYKNKKNFLYEKYYEKNSYSTLMTYGEFLETTHLFYNVTNDPKYIYYGIYLSEQMISNFKRKDNNQLAYKIVDGIKQNCLDAMALEAASYQYMYFQFEKLNFEKINLFKNLIKKFYNKNLGGLVPAEICVNDYKNKYYIGHQYGFLKLLMFFENTKKLNFSQNNLNSINYKLLISEIISTLFVNQKKYGIPNEISDKKEHKILTDVGGNVWLINEALSPIYAQLLLNHDFFDLSKARELNYIFSGCNFILIKK